MSNRQRCRPELLAPAGEWEALRAAVANGADAVYFGLGQFNARQRAANFTLEELPEVLRYLHEHNVKGYVACNTLIFSQELPEIARYVGAIAQAGADAVIVQDLGLARLIGRLAPSLPVHASTQMTLTEPRGIELARSLGVRRVILARELSIDQIGQIAAVTDMELEVFVHGALCVSYSGQCLASEAIWGRSANRGQCAQACRLPYELIVDGQARDQGDNVYLLSTQDLAAVDRVSQLVELGVTGFKIEGRLKSAQYVAATTHAYRAALDAAMQGRIFALSRQQELDLAQSFSRGFTHGFLDGADHQTLIHGRFPKSRGLRLGTVAGRSSRGVLVTLEAGSIAAIGLKAGDGVVFDTGGPEQDEQGGRVFAVEPGPGAGQAELVFGRGDVSLSAIAIGNTVWKTDDPAIRRRLEQSYARDVMPRRAPLAVRAWAQVGQPLRIRVSDPLGHEVEVRWDQPLQQAQKHPLTAELVREQFGRLGDTPFEIASVELIGDAAPGAMAPKSVLNDLRRQAVQLLLEARQARSQCAVVEPQAMESLRREAAQRKAEPAPAAQLYVLVRSLEQLRAVLEWRPPSSLARPAMAYCDFEDLSQYPSALALGRSAGMPIALAMPRIIKPGEERFLAAIAACNPTTVLVRTPGGLSFFRQATPHIACIGDSSLNVANELTADLLAGQGLRRMTVSHDLNHKQLAAMLERLDPLWLELVIHQHMPMLHLEHCFFAARLSRGRDARSCGQQCHQHELRLRDRVGMKHPVRRDAGCRNTVFSGQPQSAAQFAPEMIRHGLRHFRVELLAESAEAVAPLLQIYAGLLAGAVTGTDAWRQLLDLSPAGVTRGSLDFA